MIICDVNLLVQAVMSGPPLHDRARRWLEEALEVRFHSSGDQSAHFNPPRAVDEALSENQAELASADTDFGRFKGLRWVNPLAEG